MRSVPIPIIGILALTVVACRSTTEPGSTGPQSNGVAERLNLYGDLRLRHEHDFELDDRPDRDRQRLRARLGANYQLTDEMRLGVRVVTGDPDDARSNHVTFGDGFDDLELSLDRAFLNYQPASLKGAFFTAGKFNHPFTRNPIYGELVWDADVQPEGAVVGRTFGSLGPFESWKLTLGGYTLLEQSQADEAHMVVSELAGRMRLGESTISDVAVSYYAYSDVTPDGSSAILADNAGNATVDTNMDGDPDEFVSDFGVLNALTRVTFETARQPVTLSLEYVENLRADIDRDSGWAAGVSVGKGRKEGEWRAYYQWQVIEQDAVFSAFAQDDFLLATNHKSHVFGINYQLLDDVGLHLWGLVSARDETSAGPMTDSDDDEWRVRLDLDIKF